MIGLMYVCSGGNRSMGQRLLSLIAAVSGLAFVWSLV